MSESSPFLPESGVAFLGKALDNPAVACCCSAAHRAFRSAIERGKSDHEAMTQGIAEYRRTMPPLTGARNIRDFVACVGHGVLIDALHEATATRLLYAAQVAHCTRRPKNRSQNTVQEPISPANEQFTNPSRSK